MADTARARPEADLRRDATLEALAFTAQRLLETPDWEGVAPQVLRRLGEAVDVSRAAIIRVETSATGDRHVRQLSEWLAAGVASMRRTAGEVDRALATSGFARWEEVLGRGDVIVGQVAGFPEPERRALQAQGIRSVLAVPIFVGQDWWGHIGVDDVRKDREWSPVEIDALRAAAGAIGAAISRQRTEEQLRQAEARFRALVERTPAVTYQELVPDAYHSGASVLYVSPHVERLLGYPAERWWQVPGFWKQILHPGDLDRVLAESERTTTAGDTYSQEYRMISADGRVVWFHDEAILLRDEAGQPQVWQGVMVDITDLKHTEERFHEAEAKYRALVEHIPAVTYRQTLDGDPEQFYISPQVQDLFGYTPKDWQWTPNFWLDRIHPEDREIVGEADRETDRSGIPFDLVYRFRREDGEYVWVHDHATFIRQEDGPDFWQGFMVDVSERREISQALEEAEARYRQLVEQVPVIIYTQTIDPQDPSVTNTVYISPRSEDVLGYTVEETLRSGTLWRDIIHPEDREHVLSVDVAGNATGEDFAMEYRMIAKDGHVVWIHDEATVVRDAEGAPVAWQGFMLDITERKHAEGQLEHALQVERDAAGRLRALDEMKNTFLQAVSHDLRTPLAAILGLAVTLERSDIQLEAGEAEDLARRIATNARKLDRMVSDLLDLDRLARGIIEPKLHPTDVGALVQRVADESDLATQDRVRVEAPKLVASVDASKVERIVENLLANSLRHTPAGTPVWVRVEPAEGGVLITVEDEGPGVPEDHRETIFEPFRQGPGAPEHAPGVGVGLALVARFAELLGGRAWVQEREGGGASFRVFLSDGPASAPENPAG